MDCHVRRAYASFGLLKNSWPLLLLRYRVPLDFNAHRRPYRIDCEECDSDWRARPRAQLPGPGWQTSSRARATERIRVQRIPRYAENYILCAAGTVTLQARRPLSFPLLRIYIRRRTNHRCQLRNYLFHWPCRHRC